MYVRSDFGLRICNANLDNRDIVAIMPTGNYNFFTHNQQLNRCRRWQVAELPAARAHSARLYDCHLASTRAHVGPDNASS